MMKKLHCHENVSLNTTLKEPAHKGPIIRAAAEPKRISYLISPGE